MKKLIMVKFGGAVLTDKTKPCTIRWEVMDALVQQLAECIGDLDAAVLLGNGGGSFGHYYAEKYGVLNGNLSREALMGMCMGKNGNAYLNTELVKKLLKYQIPACTCKIEQLFQDKELDGLLLQYLDQNVLPVVYGDMLYKERTGYSAESGDRYHGGCYNKYSNSGRVVSTEEIFFRMGQILMKEPAYGYDLEKIIFCTDRDGVEGRQGQVIPFISRKNFHSWEIFQRKAEGYDVTGGMLGKVRMAFELKCPVQIINGNDAGRLKSALRDVETVGTVIYG